MRFLRYMYSKSHNVQCHSHCIGQGEDDSNVGFAVPPVAAHFSLSCLGVVVLCCIVLLCLLSPEFIMYCIAHQTLVRGNER